MVTYLYFYVSWKILYGNVVRAKLIFHASSNSFFKHMKTINLTMKGRCLIKKKENCVYKWNSLV